MDEDEYHATPQVQGRYSHSTVDNNKIKDKNVITSLSVYSDTLGLMGKIDIYRIQQKQLIERKYRLQNIFQGQIYQLWAQYFCMCEMGYDIQQIAFYEISTNTTISQQLPTKENLLELSNFIDKFNAYNPLLDHIKINIKKCQHCIYSKLCDKSTLHNVYD